MPCGETLRSNVKPLVATEDTDEADDDAKPTGREYDEMFVRHWSSWETPGTYSRIFSFDLKDGSISGNGMADGQGTLKGDSPSKPFGGGEEITWGADGKYVLFALRTADKNEPRSTNLDLYSSRYDDGKPKANVAATNLTKDNEATDNLPCSFS